MLVRQVFLLMLGIWQYFTFAQYAYMVLSGTVKLSILFFYLRVFQPDSKSKLFIIFGIVFVAASHTALFFPVFFSCSPVERAWNPLVEGRCISPVPLPYVSGAVSTSTDIYILAVPIRLLWGLNMKLRKKIKVAAVFAIICLYVTSPHLTMST